MKESGWLIEREMNGSLHYWTGRVDDMRTSGNISNNHAIGISLWSRESLDALRFARRQDAEVILYRLCAGVGRVAEHGWG